MNKNIILVLGIILLGIIGFLTWSNSDSSPSSCKRNDLNCYSDTTSWKTFTDEEKGTTFKYPESLPTTYITTQEWPPVIDILPEKFSCSMGARKINGRNYCLQTQTEGAAGSVYTTYNYSTDTAVGDETITAKFTLRAVQCGNFNEAEKTACENQQTAFDLDRLLDRIISTLARMN